jgi:hypothetical protein
VPSGSLNVTATRWGLRCSVEIACGSPAVFNPPWKVELPVTKYLASQSLPQALVVTSQLFH